MKFIHFFLSFSSGLVAVILLCGGAQGFRTLGGNGHRDRNRRKKQSSNSIPNTPTPGGDRLAPVTVSQSDSHHCDSHLICGLWSHVTVPEPKPGTLTLGNANLTPNADWGMIFAVPRPVRLPMRSENSIMNIWSTIPCHCPLAHHWHSNP